MQCFREATSRCRHDLRLRFLPDCSSLQQHENILWVAPRSLKVLES